MRYIKQYDGYSCGPVAVINAMKWLGYRATNKQLPRIRSVCRTNYGGTEERWLGVGLIVSVHKFGRVLRQRVSIKSLDKHLDSGAAAIIGYYYKVGKKICGHYVFCPGKTRRGRYIIINESNRKDEKASHKTIVYRNKRELCNMLRPIGKWRSDIWIVQRKIKN